MKLTSNSFEHNGFIPPRLAFATHDEDSQVALADNLNPHLSWSDAPDGTQSYVLICVDPDAPTVADDVNKEDRQVPADLPRGDFHHWVMVDIPASVDTLIEGGCSMEVTARGKSTPAGPLGSRQGQNDYTHWFAGDADMEGVYLGYDGPCPPWNDSIVHHYHFRLYALDIAQCEVDGAFTAQQVMDAIDGHVLASAELVGRYTLTPELMP